MLFRSRVALVDAATIESGLMERLSFSADSLLPRAGFLGVAVPSAIVFGYHCSLVL